MSPETDMERLTAYNNLQEAKRNAGRTMRRIVDLKAQMPDTPEEEEIRGELLYYAEKLMYMYVEQARRYADRWERLNP